MSKKRKEQKAIAPADQPAEPEVDQTEDVSETAEREQPTGPTPATAEPSHSPATATASEPAEPESERPAPQIGIDQVLRRVAEEIDEPLPASYRPRLQEVRLTPEQAETAARVHGALRDLGVPLRKVGDVFGWLLDQVIKSARE